LFYLLSQDIWLFFQMNSKLEIIPCIQLKQSDTFRTLEKKIEEEQDHVILSEMISNISFREDDKEVSFMCIFQA
jgi:hypothetical protein